MKSRIMTICSAKGGVGASFLANNLGVGLGLATKLPPLIVDLDLFYGGSQASLLSLEKEVGERHLMSAAEDPRLSAELLPQYVTKHPKLDVHLLAAPPGNRSNDLDPARLYDILLYASHHYKFIVIDAALPSINELTGVCFDCSSTILSLVIPDIVSLQTTSQFFQKIDKANFPLNKFELVVNMSNLSSDLEVEWIESYFREYLKKGLLGEIPFEPLAVIKSINRGVPILQKGKAENVIGSLVGLVKKMTKIPYVNLADVHISSIPDLEEAVRETPKKVRFQTDPTPAQKALTTLPKAIAGWSLQHYKDVKHKIHARLLEEARLQDMELDNPDKRKWVRDQLRDKISEIMVSENIEIPSRKDRLVLIEELLDEALGLGPLDSFLKDESITEIMVNGPDHIFIERRGKLSLSHRTFLDEKQLRVVIDRIVAPLGRRVDESSPMVDARLPDKSRVNIIIPPLALEGATITIRKFPSERLQPKHLIEFGSATQEMVAFLQGAVEARLNVLICGGTGSGKTTLLNIMSSFIPEGARIVTIEDAAELQLQQEHVIRLEARPANVEGKGLVTIRDLVKNSLRMRPDRIVVGEVRGGEALDMLQAMNTGHDGSLTTCHANAPREALSRLETMVLMAGVDLPIRAIRDQISSAVDLIVHQSRLRDGTRKITHVVEVTGMEGDIITTQDIFKYEQTGFENEKVIGGFEQADIRPSVLERFTSYGVPIPQSFQPGYHPTEQSMDEPSLDDFLDNTSDKKKGFFWK